MAWSQILPTASGSQQSELTVSDSGAKIRSSHEILGRISVLDRSTSYRSWSSQDGPKICVRGTSLIAWCWSVCGLGLSESVTSKETRTLPSSGRSSPVRGEVAMRRQFLSIAMRRAIVCGVPNKLLVPLALRPVIRFHVNVWKTRMWEWRQYLSQQYFAWIKKPNVSLR